MEGYDGMDKEVKELRLKLGQKDEVIRGLLESGDGGMNGDMDDGWRDSLWRWVPLQDGA